MDLKSIEGRKKKAVHLDFEEEAEVLHTKIRGIEIRTWGEREVEARLMEENIDIHKMGPLMSNVRHIKIRFITIDTPSLTVSPSILEIDHIVDMIITPPPNIMTITENFVIALEAWKNPPETLRNLNARE